MKESEMLFQELRPETPEERPLFDGVTLRKYSCQLADAAGASTLVNVYETVADPLKCRFDLLNSPIPKTPRSYLNGLGDAALINVGFMYTTDRTAFTPQNYAYHLQVSGGRLWSLPTKTKFALVARDGQLDLRMAIASGLLQVGDCQMPWIGSHEDGVRVTDNAIAFGTSNQGLIKDGRTVVSDTNHERIEPRRGWRQAIFNLIDGNLRLSHLTEAPVPFLAGALTMQIPQPLAAQLRVGAPVEDWIVGSLHPGIVDDAVTIGCPLFHEPKGTEIITARERIVITRRPDGTPYYNGAETRKGRSCIFTTVDGLMHFLMVDARPKIPEQNGLSLPQLTSFLHDRYDIAWAAAGDGGQSSKICYHHGNDGGILGNLHYVNHKRGEPFWDGIDGRPVTTCAVVRPNFI